ncbi:hypothetical protein RUND412_000133 [Rhizina undulata]
MHYIRFLKTPRFAIAPNKRSGVISALVTITSDLGESFYFGEAGIVASLVSVTPGTLQSTMGPDHKVTTPRRRFQWRPDMRALKIEIDVPLPKRTGGSVPATAVLEVKSEASSADDLYALSHDNEIITAHSAPFQLINGAEADSYVERRLAISRDRTLRIWEETGESIARHIWDGGLALTAYLVQNITGAGRDEGALSALHEKLRLKRTLNVLELGSGCGLVGLALSSLRKGCTVTLTDLPLAGEILNKNLQDAQPQGQAVFRVLDWDEELPIEFLANPLDLVIVADCTYNVASAPSLVRVMTKLVNSSPDSVIVLAHKKRHDSEKVFFELMNCFNIVDQLQFKLGAESVDIYTLRSGFK